MQPVLLVVAELLWLKDHHEFRQRSGERERHLAVIFLQHRRACVLADVEGLIERKANADGHGNLSFSNLLLVDQQGRGCSLSNATAVISELDANKVIARRKRLIRRNTIFVL